MSVRAKFYVSKLEIPAGAAAGQVTLNAVCRGIENSMWAQATPWGTITMGIKNEAALPLFEEHEEYEVTFTKVTKPKPNDGHQITQAVNQYGGIICETCGMQLGATQEAIDKGYWGRDTQPGLMEENVAAHEKHYAAVE